MKVKIQIMEKNKWKTIAEGEYDGEITSWKEGANIKVQLKPASSTVIGGIIVLKGKEEKGEESGGEE